MPKLDEGHAQSINDSLEQDDDRDYPSNHVFIQEILKSATIIQYTIKGRFMSR